MLSRCHAPFLTRSTVHEGEVAAQCVLLGDVAVKRVKAKIYRPSMCGPVC